MSNQEETSGQPQHTLAWKHLGILPEVLEETDSEVYASLLGLLPSQPELG